MDELVKKETCPCPNKPQTGNTTTSCEKTSGGKNYEWSQLGPVAPFLDPQFHCAKPIPQPAIQAPKFDYTKEYLKKLSEKYPQLCGILQSSTPDEILARVDNDRLKSTYQQDFGESGISAVKDCLLAAEKRDLKPSSVDCERNKNKKKKKGPPCGCAEKPTFIFDEHKNIPLPAWKSEYQSVIAKTGEAILKCRMHSRKEKKRKTFTP